MTNSLECIKNCLEKHGLCTSSCGVSGCTNEQLDECFTECNCSEGWCKFLKDRHLLDNKNLELYI